MELSDGCLLHDPLLQSHQESLTEVEEKYKKAMVSNAQLDNDKGNLIYQVDTLKDVIEEMEESMSEMKRELEEKTKVRSSWKQRLCGERTPDGFCLGFRSWKDRNTPARFCSTSKKN